MHVRICRQCGEEYRPEIARCADCGGELVDRHEDGMPVGAGGAAPGDGTPAEADQARVEVAVHNLYLGAIPDLEPLAAALREADIAYHLGPHERTFALGVGEAEWQRAIEALAPFAGRATELGVTELAFRYDPEAWAAEATRCPACGTAHAPTELECPECGLTVGGGPDEDDDKPQQ